MDTIYVSKLPLLSLVGVYAYEKENPQPLYLDLTIDISLSDAAGSDDLGTRSIMPPYATIFRQQPGSTVISSRNA